MARRNFTQEHSSDKTVWDQCNILLEDVQDNLMEHAQA